MKIQILHLLEGAKKARGVTVIIDVFRAFTVEAYLAQGNAERIIPVGDVERAFQLRKEGPDVVLVGERGGRMIEGFDYGNSPSQVASVDFTGKTVVHTTSAGTQGIAHAVHAEEILSGSLVNAAAVARYLQRKNPAMVSLVCMGRNAEVQTEEDTLCARYIKSLLEGTPICGMEQETARLKELPCGSVFFDPSRQEFPQADFALCTQMNIFDFVLRLTEDAETGTPYMEKICC